MTCYQCHPWRWESERPADVVEPVNCSPACARSWYEASRDAYLDVVRHYMRHGNAWSAGRAARILTRFGRRLLVLANPPAPPATES